MDPYKVLGVPRNAADSLIRSRYRGLSSMYHPDKETGDRQKFEEVKLAHDILMDPKRRQRYDTTGRIDEDRVTPERVQLYFNEMMRTVVSAQRPDGTSDDPVFTNVKDKLLLSLEAARISLRNDRYKLDRQLERCVRLQERFKPRTEFDPIGKSLKSERERLEQELRMNEDAMQLSIAVENAIKEYDYDFGVIVEPGSEGHFNPGSTSRRLLGGSFTRSTGRF